MKNLTLIIIIILTGFVFGQNIPVPPAMPSIPKKIENIHVTTVCPDYPDHEAYFPNGTETFIKKLENAVLLDSVKTNNGENTLKAILNFIVERDGSIAEIEVIGSDMNFNTVVKKSMKQINGKWIPAKHNGNFVRSKLKIPITINLK
ncbi:energy transducer TonB [Chryseobacterium indoltheticum]|uniref:energy transducer TonB n=1 Tax=Chryseobacterium indoltheticum TaxID=254 RepID=UPI004042E9E7